MTTVLLLCGSARVGSTSQAVLATAAALAPAGVDCVSFVALAELPLFTPDRDAEGIALDARVADLRALVGRADAVLICTPEYAGALPAAMKNLLEWTIGDGGLDGMPTAWINASGPAAPTGGADAHASLGKVLAYASATVVRAACARVPATREMVGPDGTIGDPAARTAITTALARLVAAASDAGGRPSAP
jgi:chromate reductase, NAD(P)H dehydrogenase (quinone)